MVVVAYASVDSTFCLLYFSSTLTLNSISRSVMAQKQDSSSELKEVKDEIERKDAILSSLEGQAAEFRQLQELLEGWETNTGSGRLSKSPPESFVQQVSTRKGLHTAHSALVD